jgi:hypothetical protein
VDNCVYINGDFVETEVEWIKNPGAVTLIPAESVEAVLPELKKLEITRDVSQLAGRTVQLVFRMRGTKLYAMQFVNE